MTMWGGRFDEPGADALVRAINDSLPFDRALAAQDIEGSRAWARALAAAGVLTEDEAARLVDALNRVETLAVKSKQAIVESGAEDIHTWVESELVRLVGDLGKKLHTGRSRNDQVATDLRLWTRAEIAARIAEIRRTQMALVDLAERNQHVILPGYTHLQRAQPVPFAHWCLAYVEMLERDAGRFSDAAKRANECTLGSGALAGTAYPIDREALADDLGFDAPTRNSLDAVSDRDFAVESLAACALCQVHLSRLAEDLIIYASGEFGFVALSDAASTGSSLMPQKKNPDALELMRGKTGRVTGALVALLTALKGLPLAYNKDMQEDKEPLFDAMRALSLSLCVAPMVLTGLRVDADRCEAAAKAGYSNATDAADYLVARGVPFRDAHAIAGRLVRRALAQGVALDELPLSEYQSEHKAFAPDVLEWIALRAGMERRNVIGGAAPSRVAAALKEAKERVRGALEGVGPCPSK